MDHPVYRANFAIYIVKSISYILTHFLYIARFSPYILESISCILTHLLYIGAVSYIYFKISYISWIFHILHHFLYIANIRIFSYKRPFILQMSNFEIIHVVNTYLLIIPVPFPLLYAACCLVHSVRNGRISWEGGGEKYYPLLTS